MPILFNHPLLFPISYYSERGSHLPWVIKATQAEPGYDRLVIRTLKEPCGYRTDVRLGGTMVGASTCLSPREDSGWRKTRDSSGENEFREGIRDWFLDRFH